MEENLWAALEDLFRTHQEWLRISIPPVPHHQENNGAPMKLRPVFFISSLRPQKQHPRSRSPAAPQPSGARPPLPAVPQ